MIYYAVGLNVMGKSLLSQWAINTDSATQICMKDISHLMTFEAGKKINPVFNNSQNIIIDSGAFGFMKKGQQLQNINWVNYVEQYAAFVKGAPKCLRGYMELDIDTVVGLPRVEELRTYLTQLVGAAPIVVWHPSRGKDYYKKMLDKYPYVAIPLSGELKHVERIPRKISSILPFIKMAKIAGVKIHGLGMGDTKLLPHLPFDSVDSITWIRQSAFGGIYKFKGSQLSTYCTTETRAASLPDRRMISLREVIQYQRYAATYL